MNSAASDTARYWVHDLSPFLVKFSESVGVRYYGMAYALAFVIGYLLLAWYWRARRSPVDPQAQSNLMIALIVGVMVGGRLGYFLLYTPEVAMRNPLAVFRVWEGGMASHGGFIGVCLAVIWFSWKHRIHWRTLGDIMTTLAPPGFLLGRIANFINGELWGKASTVSWAVIFPDSAPAGTPLSMIAPRHPSQLYEALLEGLMLIIYTQLRFWKSDITQRKPGHLSGEFLVAYAIARLIGENFREPDASLLFGMSRGSFYSLFFIIAGVVLMLTSRSRTRNAE